MIVTINTDASYSSEFKRGAFAFWITSNMGRVQHSGPIKIEVVNPSQAELMAIINAVHTLAKLNYKNVSCIIINSDSHHSLVALQLGVNQEKTPPAWCKDLIPMFYKIIEGSEMKGTKLSFRHVKAHKDTDTKRTWVNEWCDTEAKRWLRLEVKKLKNKIK